MIRKRTPNAGLRSVFASLATLLAILAAPVQATTAPRAPALQAGPPTSGEEVASWLDPLMAEQMAQNQIPGAVFLLVRDGEVLFSRGYGLADIGADRAVDPETDIWRVMSISKPVTAMAVMQLAKQGRLDLHRDVNQYLEEYQVEGGYDTPVTAHSLLTHTAGLDYDLDDIGAEARDPANVLPLSSFLQQQPPARVRPPGQMPVYSNAAFDVLGQVVEDVSGQAFADYVQEYILKPLGMTDSTFEQPPPGVANLVTGYELDGDAHRIVPLPYFHNPPSRSLTASAPDMANLLIALLSGGSLDGVEVLSRASVETMLSTQFTPKAGTSGSAYGFDERIWPGGKTLWKDGGGAGALSRIVLYPEDSLGFFIAYNLDDHGTLLNEVNKAFNDRYYPETSKAEAPPADAAAGGSADLTGVYRLPNYSRHTAAKALRLGWDPYPRVDSADDGSLLVTYNPGADPIPLVPVEPRHYRDMADALDYVFVTDDQGRVTHYAVGTYVAEKVSWYDIDRLHRLLLLGFMLIFLAGMLTWPVTALLRRRRGQPAPSSPLSRWAMLLLTLVSGLNLLFLFALYAVLNLVEVDVSVGMPAPLSALMLIPLITGLLALVMVAIAIVLWRSRTLPTVGRALFSLAAVMALLFIPWLNYWNLLGWRW